MADKNIKLQIKSDGTSKGTSLVVNGIDVTKAGTVTHIYFSAYSYGDVYFSWEQIEKEGKLQKVVTYRLSMSTGIVTKKNGIGKDEIGKDADRQFVDKNEEAAHKLTGNVKNLEDVIQVEDKTEKEPEPEKK